MDESTLRRRGRCAAPDKCEGSSDTPRQPNGARHSVESAIRVRAKHMIPLKNPTFCRVEFSKIQIFDVGRYKRVHGSISLRRFQYSP
jgi:hypothetical protein